MGTTPKHKSLHRTIADLTARTNSTMVIVGNWELVDHDGDLVAIHLNTGIVRTLATTTEKEE